MFRLIVIIIGFMLTTVSLLGQYSFDWLQPSGNYAKTSVMSVVDSSDNLIVTGFLQNYQTYTRKYNISGVLLWEVADSSGVSGMYEKPNWINCDLNNNIFVIGNRYSYSSSTGWDYPDAIIALKYSPAGTLLWKTIIPITIGITPFNRFNAKSVLDNNGNLYIGTALTTPAGAVLYKLDPSGNILFTKSSNLNLPRTFSSMRLKNDRIVLATGSPTTSVAPVFVYDTSGALLWTAAAVGNGAADVEIDEIDNVYILSHLTNSVSASSGIDINVTKFNSTGIQLWNHDYDFGGGEIPTRFVYLNNRISIIGYGPSSSSAAYFDWKTLQTDTAGLLLWHAIYDETTFNDEEPYNLVAKPNGEVIVTGKGGPSPIPNNPSFIQMPIVQYSNTGSQLWVDTPNIYGGWGWACMFASDASLYAISSSNMTVYHYNILPVAINENLQKRNSVNIFPNPVSSTVTIEFNLSETQNVSISIFDILGREVVSSIPDNLKQRSDKIEMDLSELNNGIYFIRINSIETFMKKIIIEK